MLRKDFTGSAPIFPITLRVRNALVFHLKNLFPESKLIEKLRTNLEMDVRSTFKVSHPLPIPIEYEIPLEKFNKHYLKTATPVILKGAACHWDCVKKWDPSYLKEVIGKQTISFLSPQDLSYNQQEHSSIGEIDLSEFLEHFGNTNLNLRFSNLVDLIPQLRNDINLEWVRSFSHQSRIGIQSFISHQNLLTPLHAESSSFFYIMCKGKKHWKLFRPLDLLNLESEKFSTPYLTRKEKATGIQEHFHFEGTIEEGDILYVPTWMWHEVLNLENSIAINTRFISIADLIKNPEISLGRILYSRPFILKKLIEAYFSSKPKTETLTPKFTK